MAGALAAIGASVCCVGPLVLLALGIGGTWVGSLTAMEPFRPWFIGLTLLFLGLAFRKLYLVPRVCAPGIVALHSQIYQHTKQYRGKYGVTLHFVQLDGGFHWNQWFTATHHL
jgi:hypothetical protein